MFCCKYRLMDIAQLTINETKKHFNSYHNKSEILIRNEIFINVLLKYTHYVYESINVFIRVIG